MAAREASVRRWVHQAQKSINENLQISVGQDGVEVTVTNLTDMPDLVEWALSRDDPVLSLPLSIVVSKGPWKGENMVTAAESFFQTNAYHPFAICSKGHTNPMPMTKVVLSDTTVVGGPTTQREIQHFCQHRECMCMDAEHFRSNRQEVKDTSFLEDKGVFSFRTIPAHESIRGPIRTFREFSRYVARMSDRKAAGKDMMPADLFKRAPEAFRRNAWSLINLILADEYTCRPDILEAKVILLCKDVTSPDLLGNYRPIALCNAFYQLLNSIITSRLRHLTEKYAVLEATQFGFRNARAVQLVIQKARWLTRQAMKSDGKLIRVDLDFKNAFNSAGHSCLWKILEGFGVPDVSLLKDSYENSSMRIQVDGAATAAIQLDTGTVQGSTLSPLLFDLFINALLRLLDTTGISHKVKNLPEWNHQAFADDLSLYVSEEHDAQTLLDLVAEFQEWSGLKISIKKTIVTGALYGKGAARRDELARRMGRQQAIWTI